MHFPTICGNKSYSHSHTCVQRCNHPCLLVRSDNFWESPKSEKEMLWENANGPQKPLSLSLCLWGRSSLPLGESGSRDRKWPLPTLEPYCWKVGTKSPFSHPWVDRWSVVGHENGQIWEWSVPADQYIQRCSLELCLLVKYWRQPKESINWEMVRRSRVPPF